MDAFIEIIATIFLLMLVVLGFYFIYSLMISTPFYPSRIKALDKAFDELDIEANKNKKFIDLGSGDGRVVLWAAKKGFDAYGVDENPYLILLSRIRTVLFHRGLSKHAHIIHGSFNKIDLSEYAVIYMYIYPKHMESLKEKLKKEMSKDAVILSNTFTFKDVEPIAKSGHFYIYKLS